MTRPALVASSVAGVLTLTLATSWIGAALLIAAILIPAASLCWVLADHDRPRRLALLLTAWRQGTPPAAIQPYARSRPDHVSPTKPQQPKHRAATKWSLFLQRPRVRQSHSAVDQHTSVAEPRPAPKVFINYRVGDGEQTGTQFYSELGRALGVHNVFFASLSTPPGANFRQVIEARLRQSDVMLTLIGPRWMDIMDEREVRKLDRDEDLVRWEIERALTLKLRVIPVLLDNATLDATRLPPQITDLSNLHWLNYRYNYGHHDLQLILDTVRSTTQRTADPTLNEGAS